MSSGHGIFFSTTLLISVKELTAPNKLKKNDRMNGNNIEEIESGFEIMAQYVKFAYETKRKKKNHKHTKIIWNDQKSFWQSFVECQLNFSLYCCGDDEMFWSMKKNFCYKVQSSDCLMLMVGVWVYILCLKLDKVPLDPFNTMLDWTSSESETMLSHFNLIMLNERRNSSKIPQTKVNNISIENVCLRARC